MKIVNIPYLFLSCNRFNFIYHEKNFIAAICPLGFFYFD